MSRQLNFRVFENSSREKIHEGHWKSWSCYHGINFRTIQQSTGVFDQNNKEIYEGDIVYLNYLDCPEIDSKNLFEIIFKRGCFQLKPIKLSPPPFGGNGAFSWVQYIEGWDKQGYEKYRYELPPPRPICDFNIMVVVGNIFENLELLG